VTNPNQPVVNVRLTMAAVTATQQAIEAADDPQDHLNTLYLSSMIELAKTTDMRDRFKVDRSTEKQRQVSLKRRDSILARHACAFRDVEILRRVADAMGLELMDVAAWAREMHQRASEKSAGVAS
jgi:hypothetical protein